MLCVVVAPDRHGSADPSQFGPNWTGRENPIQSGDTRTKQHVPRGGNSPVPAEKSALPGLYFFAPPRIAIEAKPGTIRPKYPGQCSKLAFFNGLLGIAAEGRETARRLPQLDLDDGKSLLDGIVEDEFGDILRGRVGVD
jgi:hypothetical protein